MIRPASVLLLMALLLSLPAIAQPVVETGRSQTSGVDFYTANNGIFGNNIATGEPGFIYPRGATGIAYIFGGGLWFGARKMVDDTLRTLSMITYSPNSGVSWTKPGEWTTERDPAWSTYDRLAYSPAYDRGTGAYTGSGNRPAWPLWTSGNTAPAFYDPGIYVTDSASRTPAVSGTPAFVAGVAEQFVSRYHDGDTSLYERRGGLPGFPIGLQIEQNVYGFSQAEHNATVILHYRVINVSGDTLRDCYISSMLDPDIGPSIANDAAKFYTHRPELQTGFAWSGLEARTPGTVAVTLLETPAVETNQSSPSFGFVRHDRRSYDEAEQIGLTTFQNWTIQEDQTTPVSRYDFMASGDLDTDDTPADRRILLASGPFNLAPGDTARLAVGMTVLPAHRVTTSGPQLPVEQAAERMITLYRAGSISSVGAWTRTSEKMSIGYVVPNPASGTTSIDLHLARRSDVRLQLVDALGRVVLARESTMMEAGNQTLSLDLGGVAPGVYIISIEAAGERASRRIVVSL